MVYILGIVCLLATTVGAVSGIGGGVIIKPIMDAVSGLPVAQISFLSGCTVLAMSAVSLLRSLGDEVAIEPRRGTLLALGGAVGGIAGKWIFDLALQAAAGSSGLVGVIQNAIMVLLTVGVLVYTLYKDKISTHAVQGAVLCMGIGFGLGLLSAFLGIGGGPINLVVLYYFFSMGTKVAALHSIYIILFSQIASLASTILGGRLPQFDPVVLGVMVLCGVLGGFAGRSLTRRMTVQQVDTLFRCLLVVITAISVYNLFRYGTM